MLLRLTLLTLLAGLTALLINQGIALRFEDAPTHRRGWPSVASQPARERGQQTTGPGAILRRDLFDAFLPPVVIVPAPSDFVTRLGPQRFRLDRGRLQPEVTRASGARVIPNYRDDRLAGFKIVGVQLRSVYAKLGIVDGDIMCAVDGIALTTPNRALALYEALSAGAVVSLTIERDWRLVTITYEMVGPPW